MKGIDNLGGDTMEEAYRLGSGTAMACLAKIPAYCPYEPGSDLYTEWVRGYEETARLPPRLRP